ncbi:MAG TPA: tRNA lysidine(34) synthetase TilS [Kofleriaceae bacterium]|nr:tRNA lysidine(34) synthetase TilS [Kofleriaceae bacterium]
MDRFQRELDRALGELGVDRAAPVLVACSGGADSAALAHAAMALAAAGRLGRVTLCHVDHQLRPGSAADARIVADLAAAGGAGFDGRVVEVARDQGSLEAAARAARYRALAAAAADHGAGAILVGHTARDQAETVLMRLLRGTGVAGLAGIPARRGLVARPLLGVERAAIEAYCRAHALALADDPSNQDLRHFRNRVRLEILPALRRVNPAVDAALLRIAAAAGDSRAALDFAADLLAEKARAPGGAWRVDLLARAPGSVLAHFVAREVGAAGGGPLGARHHRALAALVGSAAGGTSRVDLPGLTAWREYELLRLERRGNAAVPEPPPGLDVSGPDGPYEVRTWRPGDRMRPARLRGRSRKLSDLYIDARVPRRVRAAARVVTRASDGRIEWAEHLGPAFGSPIAVVTLTPRESVATNKNR